MRAHPRRRRLEGGSMHAPLERFEDEFDAVLEEARTLGVETLIMPWVPTPENAPTPTSSSRGSSPRASRSRDGGLRFGYHNHAFEFGEVGPVEPARRDRAGPRARRRLAAGRRPRSGDQLELAGRPHACSSTPRTCGATATAGWTSSPATASSTAGRSPRRRGGGASHLVVELDTPVRRPGRGRPPLARRPCGRRCDDSASGSSAAARSAASTSTTRRAWTACGSWPARTSTRRARRRRRASAASTR